MSQVGIEFMINFTLNYHHSSGSGIGVGTHTVNGKIQTHLKKLLHLQKTRDAVVPIGNAPKMNQDPHQTPSKEAERV